MAIDFRANQIRVEKIISSGSSILIYPSGAASDLTGTINGTIFPQTGIGSDVFLFVSGGATRGGSQKNVSAFGGILVSSGAIYALAGLSGSLTKLTDGTSYLIASGGVTIVTNSNGSITIGFSGSTGGSSFAFTSTSVAFSGSTGLTGTPAFYFNDNTNALYLYADQVLTANNGLQLSYNGIIRQNSSDQSIKHNLSLISSDAGVVSGAGGDVYVNGGNSAFRDDFSPSTGGTVYLNGGSGSAVMDTVTQNGGAGGGINIYPGKGGNSTGTARGGLGGSILFYGAEGGASTGNLGGDGSSITLYGGNAGSGGSGSGVGGNIVLKSGDGVFLDPYSDSGYISIDIGYRNAANSASNANIRIDEAKLAKNILFGFSNLSTNTVTDSYFIVSGSSTKKSLFIGDMVVSGTAKIHSGISASLTNLPDGSSYLIAGSGITVASQSNGSILISASGSGSSLPSASNGSVLAYSSDTWSATNVGSLGQPLISSGSGKALFSNSLVPLQLGTNVAIPSDSALALGWAYRSIVVRDSGNTSWLDVWRADSSSYWVYGTTNGTYTTGLILTLPSSGQFFLTRGSSNHITINGSGILTLGTTTHSTVLRGGALTIGLTAVVATYQGGARIPEVTISGNTTFDTSTEMVFVDTISTVVTGTLPAGAGGRIISVQKVTGSNNYVIAVTSPDTIRVAGSGSATTWTITDTFRHSLVYRSFGTEWVAEY